MDKNETERLIALLQRRAPTIKTELYHNGMTQAYEVEVIGGDPRGVKVWLRSPLQALHYIGWLNRQVGNVN